MKQLVSRAQMETFASLLGSTKTKQALSPEAFDQLHTQFRAEDANGGMWTVGIHTRKWHRREQGQWVAAANPPEAVYLDGQLITALQALMSPGPPVTGPAGTGPATPDTTCSRCGATIPPNKKFCPTCGNPVMASPPVAPVAQRCPRCGQTVPAGKKFCVACGTRVT